MLKARSCPVEGLSPSGPGSRLPGGFPLWTSMSSPGPHPWKRARQAQAGRFSGGSSDEKLGHGAIGRPAFDLPQAGQAPRSFLLPSRVTWEN